MALSKEVVNNQIAEATAKLEARKAALKGKNFDDAKIEKDSIYKSLRSSLKDVKKRLVKIEKLEARDADLRK
jgi:hypothetical protein